MTEQNPPGQYPEPTAQQYPPPPEYPGQVPPAPAPGMGVYPPPAPSYGPPVNERPGTVTAAAVMSIVLASLGVLLGIGVGLAATLAKEDFVEGMLESGGIQGFTHAELLDFAAVLGGVFLFVAAWSAFTILTAALSLMRHNWARIITIITAGGWAVLGVVNIALSNPAGILTIAFGVTVVILYLVGQANAWYNSKPARP